MTAISLLLLVAALLLILVWLIPPAIGHRPGPQWRTCKRCLIVEETWRL